MCFLYADSNNPTLQYFADVSDPAGSGKKLDCLGQGGNDPLTHTLRQLHANYDNSDVEWAFWNDQYQVNKIVRARLGAANASPRI